MQVQSIVSEALRRSRSAAGAAVDLFTPASIPSGLREPPLLSGGLPLIGHTAEFVQSTIGMLRRAQAELGEVAALRIATKRMVALFGPQAHEAVFRAPDTHLNPCEAYKIMTPVFGKDIVYDAPPEKMAEQLKMLLPALKDRRMRTYGETIVAEVEQSIAGWGDEGLVDLVDFCRVLTNFTSSHCLLGREFRERMTSEFAEVYHDLERGVTPIAYLNAHLPLPSFRRRDRARIKLVEMISKIIDERRSAGREGEDFLQTLMDARYSSGAALSAHEITGMLLAGMFAGHHTSSVTTAWTLIELLQKPAYLERTVAQLDRVFGGGQPVSFQALREITLTEHAVKEALRLHPPLFMLVRVALKDFVYKDYFIQRGTWVLVSPTVSHQLPEIFSDPARFDPDRFAPPREEDKRDFAYIPFGGGRHKCLGNAFAILQVKAILAILFGRYEFSLHGDPIDSDFHGLVVGPKEPCRVRYRRRQRRAAAVTLAAEPQGAAVQQAMGARPAASGCPFHAAPEAPVAAVAAATPVPAVAAAAPVAPVAAAAPIPPSPAAAQVAPVQGVVQGKRLLVTVDRDLCQGHAVCVGEAPEVFQIGDDGKVLLLQERPDPALSERVLRAAQYCPTRTIDTVEE